MERRYRVIHLRTGDRGVDAEIDAWLKRRGTNTRVCADAYELCLYALRRHDDRPDLALIGADWIAPDELVIINHLREAWPDLPVVLYGRLPSGAFAPAADVIRLESAAAIRAMLAKAPEELAMPKPDSRRMAAADLGLSGRDAEMAFDLGGLVEIDKREPLVHRIRNTDEAAAPAEAEQEKPPIERALLTQEELTALLEDEEI